MESQFSEKNYDNSITINKSSSSVLFLNLSKNLPDKSVSLILIERPLSRFSEGKIDKQNYSKPTPHSDESQDRVSVESFNILQRTEKRNGDLATLDKVSKWHSEGSSYGCLISVNPNFGISQAEPNKTFRHSVESYTFSDDKTPSFKYESHREDISDVGDMIDRKMTIKNNYINNYISTKKNSSNSKEITQTTVFGIHNF